MLHFEQPQQRLAGCGYPGELFFRSCRIRTGSSVIQVARSIYWGGRGAVPRKHPFGRDERYQLGHPVSLRGRGGGDAGYAATT